MAYTFKQNLVPSSKYSIKCPYTMKPEYITVHNTSNNASAANEIKYMISNNNQTSYHVAVDEKEVIQAIPGNRKSIGIEICRSTGDVATFKKCEENAAKYIATLLKQYGWTTAKVKRHKDWSGKNCPHKTMELGWDRFVKMIQKELDILNGKTTAAKPTTSTTTSTSTTFKVGNYNKNVVTTDNLNVRRSRNAGSEFLITIPKGTTIKVNYVMYQDNSVAPKGDLWGGVTYKGATGFINLKYVKPEPVAAPASGKAVNYRVRITADSLNVRKEPNATSKVTTTVKKDNVFTIVEE